MAILASMTAILLVIFLEVVSRSSKDCIDIDWPAAAFLNLSGERAGLSKPPHDIRGATLASKQAFIVFPTD
jgi:hypothetical protein